MTILMTTKNPHNNEKDDQDHREENKFTRRERTSSQNLKWDFLMFKKNILN